MAADLTLPDGWSIGFDSDASVDPVQYRASLHQGRALRCQFCVTEKGATPESAAQHLHGLALKWIVEYMRRKTVPSINERPPDADRGGSHPAVTGGRKQAATSSLDG